MTNILGLNKMTWLPVTTQTNTTQTQNTTNTTNTEETLFATAANNNTGTETVDFSTTKTDTTAETQATTDTQTATVQEETATNEATKEVNEVTSEVANKEVAQLVTKEDLTKLEAEIKEAETELANAKTAVTTAESKLATTNAYYQYNKNMRDYYQNLVNYYNNLNINNFYTQVYQNAVTTYEKAMDVDGVQKEVDDAKAKQTEATTKLEAAKEAYAAAEAAYNTAIEDGTIQVAGAKSIFETEDPTLKKALDSLSYYDKQLIESGQIDLTETFENGRSKYYLVKGYTGQYFIYGAVSSSALNARPVNIYSFGRAPNNISIPSLVLDNVNVTDAVISVNQTTETSITKNELTDEEKTQVSTVKTGVMEEITEGTNLQNPENQEKVNTLIDSYVNQEIQKDELLNEVADMIKDGYDRVETDTETGKIWGITTTQVETETEVDQEVVDTLTAGIFEEVSEGANNETSVVQGNIQNLINSYVEGEIPKSEVKAQLEDLIKSGYDRLEVDPETNILYGVTEGEITNKTEPDFEVVNYLKSGILEEAAQANKKDSNIESKIDTMVSDYVNGNIDKETILTQMENLIKAGYDKVETDPKTGIVWGYSITSTTENESGELVMSVKRTNIKHFIESTTNLINKLPVATEETVPTENKKNLTSFLEATNSLLNKIPVKETVTETVETRKDLAEFIENVEELIDTLPTIQDTATEVTKYTSELKGPYYQPSSPLTFDIDGNGVQTSNEKITYDIDGDGKLDVINNANDAVLVFDADKDGIAGENGLELFGDNTDLDGDGVKDGYKNGFDALKALAAKEELINDFDRILDSNDLNFLAEKYGLGMKSNGYNSEVKTFEELGITEINLSETDETEIQKNFDGLGNDLMTQKGATFKINGETKSYADIWHKKYQTEE